jgi:hypothetical protein
MARKKNIGRKGRPRWEMKEQNFFMLQPLKGTRLTTSAA